MHMTNFKVHPFLNYVKRGWQFYGEGGDKERDSTDTSKTARNVALTFKKHKKSPIYFQAISDRGTNQDNFCQKGLVKSD